MKKLIILAGLPGVGKSYIAKELKRNIRNLFYFDSDLFSKKYTQKNKINFLKLPYKKQLTERLKFHKAKIEEIKKAFMKHNIIALDTCFDIVASRNIFYRFCNKQKIKLIIVQITCPEKIVFERILENKHERDRMVGNKKTRIETYKKIKHNWKPIKKVDFVIKSEKNTEKQINSFIKKFI
jgi:tRNA uridine 5-carbamoylmethylation protein Kti12